MRKIVIFALIQCFATSCNDKTIEPETPSGNGEHSAADNANTRVPKYQGAFLYGSNMGYKSNWDDKDIADALAGNASGSIEGIGVNSLRPALYEDFVETWGYGIRVETFNYYKTIGAINNTVFIGDRPSDAHREKKQYAQGMASESYENLYEPIWDNGENDTPVNDKNYYALYVYKVAKAYGNVKFWEIKNEPDFTYSGAGDKVAGEQGNWWDNDPRPADLSNWKAPIQSYIRLLRVSYEVIKHVNPDSYICVGGIGYSSFLDAILRNTDNPDGGKVTGAYPQKGGAWFDCLSYHIYPMYHLRSWAGTGFRHYRNSDDAAATVIDRKNTMFSLMAKYGYGAEYPAKEVIITEVNVPSKSVSGYLGSQETQRNFAIKLAVLSQVNGIAGVYIYGAWDGQEANSSSTDPFDYMGLYKPLPNRPGQQLRPNESGIAWRTMTSLIGDYRYNATQTAILNLPSTVEGAAFYSDKVKDYIYVLWAKTSEKDMSEDASVEYTFPAAIGANNIFYKQWDNNKFSVTGSRITLKGDPFFIKVNSSF